MIFNYRKILLIILIVLLITSVFCQTKPDKPIRLSGIVVDKQTQELLVNSHYIINNKRGGVVDASGRFAIFGMVDDTIIFSYVGYKDVVVIVSDTLRRNDYLVGIFMPRDTIVLDEVVILPRLGSLKSEISALSSIQDLNNMNAVNNLNMAAFTGISRNIQWSDADAQYKYVSNQIKMRAMEQGLVASDEMVAFNLAAGIPFLIAYYLRGPQSPDRPAVVLSQPEINLMMKVFRKNQNDSVPSPDSIRR